MTIYTIKKLYWRENQIADNDPSWRAAGTKFIDYVIIKLRSGEYCLNINNQDKGRCYSSLEDAKYAAKDHFKTEVEKNLVKIKRKPLVYKGFLEKGK